MGESLYNNNNNTNSLGAKHKTKNPNNRIVKMSESLDDCIANMSTLRLNAMTRAHEIKQYVKRVTIGPNSYGNDEIKVTLSAVDNNNKSCIKQTNSSSKNNNKAPKPKIRFSDEAEVVKHGDEDIVLLDDVNNFINYNMMSYEIARAKQDAAWNKSRDYQKKFEEMNKKIYEEANKQLTAKQQMYRERVAQLEAEILKDVERYQIESNKRQQKRAEESERQRKEIQQSLAVKKEENIQKQQEKEKSDLDIILKIEKKFNDEYEILLEKFRCFKDSFAQEVFTEHGNEVMILIHNMENLVFKCKCESVSSDDITNAQDLLANLQKHSTVMLDAYVSKVKQNELKERELKCKTESKLTPAPVPIIDPETEKSVIEKIAAIRSENDNCYSVYEIGTKANWKKWEQYKAYVENFKTCYVQLITNTAFKKFCFDCRKAVNLPVNSLAGKGEDDTKDKLNKLETLLAGGSLQLGNIDFSSRQHPQGLPFCLDLLAKSLVKQGDVVASNPDSVFPVAYVIASIWAKYPDFGKLVLGYFYTKCPFLLPIQPKQKLDSTEVEYLRSVGYDISSSGVIESEQLYLKRMCGIARLYFAVMVVNCKDRPFPIDTAWNWIADTLNIAPKTDITASLMLQCLEITGHHQMIFYKKQFFKMISVLINDYLPVLNKVDRGGPFSRLKLFLLHAAEKGTIDPPDCITAKDTISGSDYF